MQVPTMSAFSETIMRDKYAHDLDDGKESWDQIAYRVTKHVLKSVGINMRSSLAKTTHRLITEQKFIPGGRYLYAAGRPYHQVQNCLLLRCHDSREGWAELLHDGAMALMTGAGIGVWYGDVRAEFAKIRKTGGTATGPIALMQMMNECGRGIMQGGSRRSAIWAGLPWWHPDIHKFIRIKNWSPEVRALKEKDFNFPATLDCTNISVQLDDEFFEAFHDDEHEHHALANSVYWATVEQMLKTGEPGFSVDCSKNAKEVLRNAPVAGDTQVLTEYGYLPVDEIVNNPTPLWTGYQWAVATFVKTKSETKTLTISFTGDRSITCDPDHEFFVREYTGAGSRRKKTIVRKKARHLSVGDYLDVALEEGDPIRLDRREWTAGFVLGDGSTSGGKSEVSLCTDEKKVLGRYLTNVRRKSLNDARGYDRYCFDRAFPKGKIETTCLQSFLAGWFDADGSYDPKQHRIRLSGEYHLLVQARRALETLGIVSTISKPIPSGFGGRKDIRNLIVLADWIRLFAHIIPCQRLKPDKGYEPYRSSEITVTAIDSGPTQDVYCCDVGVDEHSFVAEGVRISNCTEVSSADNSDICNLGSINLARVDDIEEFRLCVEIGTTFLLAGTVYSDVPYQEVDRIRSKNRRLGLGLMGIHEWLLKRGLPYGPDEELGKWLTVYKKSGRIANRVADEWELSRPKKTRAIAPNGTISIVAGTTSGVEPVLCAAYKRRYLKGNDWHYQYVVDPAVKRMVDEGIDPRAIEDAYTLARDVERRVAFQSWVQEYVDHAISSTINLPSWGSETNNDGTVRGFGSMLIRYLPKLRGITCYPDGARGGQPLVPVSYSEAIEQEGIEFSELDACSITGGGSCGD